MAAVSGSDAGRRLYDRWSRHPRALWLLYGVVFLGRERAFRRRSVDALDLDPGDRVLELGCGPGNSLARLRERVGADGAVVALDYSAGMVEAATERVRGAGWENVHVVRADATRAPVAPSSFDAAYASMSLSAMPDAGAAVEDAVAALRPGGRIAALDARPFPRFPCTLLNPLIVPAARRLTNWVPGNDVPAAVERAAGDVAVSDATCGAVYVASARKGG